MATIETKFEYGKKVSFMGIPCTVTAIFIRGTYTSYEVSYLDVEGKASLSVAAECELESNDSNAIGFKPNGKKTKTI